MESAVGAACAASGIGSCRASSCTGNGCASRPIGLGGAFQLLNNASNGFLKATSMGCAVVAVVDVPVGGYLVKAVAVGLAFASC